MRLEDIYIDGFGRFHNHSINDLATGLTVFIGPNEAGKSTILSFIKRILFGFPDGRQKHNPYPPLAGGNHGGRLVVSTGDNKRYVIERYSNRSGDVVVTLPDGSTGGSGELSRILGFVNKDIFENIFAFGLTELQDFETLNSDEIRGRLYSAWAGTGSVSPTEVLKAIEAKTNILYKPSGAKPEINALFKDIGQINARLKEIENDIEKFDALHLKLKEITEKIGSVEGERNLVRADLNHTRSLLAAWPDWRRAQEAKERLQEIPEIESFPENGIELLERNLERLDELVSAISAKNEEFEKNTIKKSLIEIDERLIDNEEAIRGLQNGRDKYVSARDDLAALKESLKREKEALREALREIGPDWDEGKLSGFDISIPTKEAVRKKHGALESVREAIRAVEREFLAVTQSIKGIKEERAALDGRLEALSSNQVDEASLARQKRSLQVLRARYLDLREKEVEIRSLQEKEDLFGLLKPQRAEVPARLPLWPAFLLIVAGLVSLLLSTFTGSPGPGVIVLAVLSLFAVVYVAVSKKGLPAHEAGRFEDNDAGDTNGQSGDLAERRRVLESELQRIRGEMLSNAQICGFSEIPDYQSIESKDAGLQGDAVGLQKLVELSEQMEAIERKLEKLDDEARILNDRLQALRHDELQSQKEWEDWLIGKGLHTSLTTEGVIDIFSTIKACIEKKRSIDTLSERIGQVRVFLEEYETKISSVLKNCNKSGEGIEVITELEKLSRDLEKNIDDKRHLGQMVDNEKSLSLEIKNLKEKAEELEESLFGLFALGSAKSEAEFRNNARNWEERRCLLSEIASCEQAIKRVSGDGELYIDFIEELRGAVPESLNEKEPRLEESLKEIEDSLAGLRENRGGIIKEIEQIERREEGSSLQMNKMVKLQKLKVLSDEWSALILAKTIMRKALEKYEKEKQPLVIKEAQSFFSQITLGRYSRIYAPLEEARIYVEDRDGRRKDIQELSRGSAEQLYLSLRLGFIREFGKKAEALPVVFDDILVNFDPERFAAAFAAIKELAQTNQVFYFTCHPGNVDLLVETLPDLRIIDLSANQLTQTVLASS